MSDTTTIEITTTQRKQLGALKLSDSEATKDVLQRLIDNYDNPTDLTENRVREIAREEIAERVVHKAQQ